MDSDDYEFSKMNLEQQRNLLAFQALKLQRITISALNSDSEAGRPLDQFQTVDTNMLTLYKLLKKSHCMKLCNPAPKRIKKSKLHNLDRIVNVICQTVISKLNELVSDSDDSCTDDNDNDNDNESIMSVQIYSDNDERSSPILEDLVSENSNPALSLPASCNGSEEQLNSPYEDESIEKVPVPYEDDGIDKTPSPYENESIEKTPSPYEIESTDKAQSLPSDEEESTMLSQESNLEIDNNDNVEVSDSVKKYPTRFATREELFSSLYDASVMQQDSSPVESQTTESNANKSSEKKSERLKAKRLLKAAKSSDKLTVPMKKPKKVPMNQKKSKNTNVGPNKDVLKSRVYRKKNVEPKAGPSKTESVVINEPSKRNGRTLRKKLLVLEPGGVPVDK